MGNNYGSTFKQLIESKDSFTLEDYRTSYVLNSIDENNRKKLLQKCSNGNWLNSIYFKDINNGLWYQKIYDRFLKKDGKVREKSNATATTAADTDMANNTMMQSQNKFNDLNDMSLQTFLEKRHRKITGNESLDGEYYKKWSKNFDY